MITILSRASLLSLLSLAAVACSGSALSDAETTDKSSTALRSNEPAPDLSGTWAFVIEASDVAGPIREKCAAKAAGDEARAAACWNEIAAEAKTEKIRFTKQESGRFLWTSFGRDDGPKDVIYLEMPIELTADGHGHVRAKVAGKPTGIQAEAFAKRPGVHPGRDELSPIEIVDARTIAMNDPKKGRLVFSKE